MPDNQSNNNSAHEAIRQFEIQAVNFGQRFIQDSNVRRMYMEKTKAYAESLKDLVNSRQMSPSEAAQAANQMRNEIMEWARTKSSDIGRAKARALKAKGLDLDVLCDKYAKRLFSKSFSQLSKADQDHVFLQIVESSGRANPKVSAKAIRLGKAGRALWLLSAGIAIYNIASAEDKTRATGREAANLGGGFAGGAAGGAVAGLWAGPVGVAIGAVVGGVLGSIVADEAYIEVAASNDPFVKTFLDKHTQMFNTDEEAIARDLVEKCSYEMDKVYSVFKELDWAYNSDADDVALLYVNRVRRSTPIIKSSLKAHTPLRNLLTAILEDGWTTSNERDAIRYVQQL
ncbi:hypothetical protein O5O45_02390 [Hahella aquimaris]|uniref:hypothetical protein n=1 Tax=Hahella sp. HNIBRBA332 TaxID=3015983 RepID=UPI00273B59CD|nr:hypothetical protein [Hahella sp. HNIBRBA332]WLQ14785.1 hypothetical protein O5O45_02390 [Hahella sp. HNIBRBA332]